MYILVYICIYLHLDGVQSDEVVEKHAIAKINQIIRLYIIIQVYLLVPIYY